MPGAELLGERQLKFLRAWAADWRGAEMKAVLSQTIFCGGAHLHGTRDYRVYADLDSDGWPHSGRNAALAEMRKAFALHIAGDQHLGTIIHHGIDDWNDACVLVLRSFDRQFVSPLVGAAGAGQEPPTRHAGLYRRVSRRLRQQDHPLGRGQSDSRGEPRQADDARRGLRDRAFPQGRIARSRWSAGRATWTSPRPTAKQYPGWPKTISQLDNYARKPAAWLPTLEVRGPADPVVQVIEEPSGEMVYALRIQGREFRPQVFHAGSYTIRVGEPGVKMQEIRGVKSLAAEQPGQLTIDLQ